MKVFKGILQKNVFVKNGYILKTTYFHFLENSLQEFSIFAQKVKKKWLVGKRSVQNSEDTAWLLSLNFAPRKLDRKTIKSFESYREVQKSAVQGEDLEESPLYSVK